MQRATRRRHLIATVWLTALVQLLVAGPAAAVDVTGLRVVRTDDPGANAPEYVVPLLPGGRATRSVTVTNTSAEDVTVLLYGADAERTDDGLTIADGTDNEGVGAWITGIEDTIAIPAGATRDLLFAVERPRGDEDGGIGAIVVQLDEASRQLVGVPTAQRAAVPVVVAADGTGDGLTIGEVTIEGDELVVTVTNGTSQRITLDGAIVDGARETPAGDGEELAAEGDEPTVLADLTGTRIRPGARDELRFELPEDVGSTLLLRPVVEVRDAAGALRGPIPPLSTVVRVGALLALALVAFVVAKVTRSRAVRARRASASRPPPLGAADTGAADETDDDEPAREADPAPAPEPDPAPAPEPEPAAEPDPEPAAEAPPAAPATPVRTVTRIVRRPASDQPAADDAGATPTRVVRTKRVIRVAPSTPPDGPRTPPRLTEEDLEIEIETDGADAD